ncbi:hypothetical protein [Paenibacillus gorillae]|nr:hypothetical protein [Paenibacillus gorillae]
MSQKFRVILQKVVDHSDEIEIGERLFGSLTPVDEHVVMELLEQMRI